MSYTGFNLGNLKNNNRSAILKLLNDQCAMSRKDIALSLGLTPATVTVICSSLIDAGILCELGEVQESRRAGRKKILLGINYDRYKVLSICIENMETCVSVTNLKGEDGAFRRIKTNTAIPPAKFLRQVARLCLLLLEEENIPCSSILGVGVTVPGPVDREAGVSQAAYRIWDEPVRVGPLLREALDLPVILANNVRAFAEAELIFGSGKSVENMLFVKWGPGVGSAIVLHKQLYQSSRSQNAEIGHFIMNAQGRECRCGRKGCLETFAGTHAMAEQLRLKCSEETMPALYASVDGDLSAINAKNFTRFLSLNEPAMWEILERDLGMLARSVCNAITMLAPDQVIIYGKLFDQPPLRERFMSICRQIDPQYNESYILLSELDRKSDYIGPLAVVVNTLFLSGLTE